MLILKAFILGIVEGVTEFLPVSSTGHLIVASAVLDYPAEARDAFDIFIQLGAILAVVWHFRLHLFEIVSQAPTRKVDRDLIGKILIAFLPAAVIGFLFHRPIERYLFSPTVVGVTLILGGILIIVVERRAWRFRTHAMEAITWREALLVGIAQTVSMIPGVSRAGATIIGGMFAGLDRPVATQFSFYLSIPTLAAASLYSLFKARHLLNDGHAAPLAIGFLTSFVAALIVVRAFIGFVQRHDFTAFGYYRIAFGILVLAVLR
ncbi:undecaprenyl-diphosphate phosphatase [Candidatus Binatia bacterium]|nr:undecaprenyl-diphosphate phosphatase [Candidatus Binatia bacterium]